MRAAFKILGAVAAYELAAALFRWQNRAGLFAKAQERARATGRPLVVVGDPDAGLHTGLLRAYSCGDLCLDKHGCPACPRALTVDITRATGLASDSAVVFASCVLEYVDDAAAGYRELLRIAGAEENLFIVRVGGGTLTTYLFPGARWLIEAAPPMPGPFRAVAVPHLVSGDGHLRGHLED